MHRQPHPYEINGKTYKGEFFYDIEQQTKRPGILVAHAWRGRDGFAKQKAKALAALGYVGMAIDLYGNGKVANSNEEAFELMQPLFLDRKELRARISAAYTELCNHPLVDSARTGAIGFCFGGLSALELLKSGAPVKGVATFHAVIGDTLTDQTARLEPNFANSSSSLLLLHGANDPLVKESELMALGSELTEAKVDWQFNIYGLTSHAFTNPDANEPGLQFNAKANARSWIAMKNYFEEVF